MSILLTLKRPFIWLMRFRHRCGYGVHSPFAFDLITNVFYEKTDYYAYSRLEKQEKQLHHAEESPLKVKRLLFRLVNRMQPSLLIDAGKPATASLYLKEAKKKLNYRKVTSPDECLFKQSEKIDFLYIHRHRDPAFVEEVFNRCLPYIHEETVFVLEGIGYSYAMKRLWRKLKSNNQVFVTFDLYDLGILFFDSNKFKQHYIVNF